MKKKQAVFSNPLDTLLEIKYEVLRTTRRLLEATEDENKTDEKKNEEGLDLDLEDTDEENIDTKVTLTEFLAIRYLKNTIDYLILVVDFLRTLYGDEFNQFYLKVLKVKNYLRDFILYIDSYEETERKRIYKAFRYVLINIINELIKLLEAL